jgi:hypothetical protein
MTISMYKISVPVFVQFLTAQSGVLDKGAAYAEAKKVDPSFFLNMRLSPNMYPLVKQVQMAATHAMRATGELAGVQTPQFPNTEASFAELKERIATAVDFVKGFKPEQIDGTEDKKITMKFGSTPREYTGQTLLLGFSLPNFYFHCTTAYDILRHCGVELVKRDFMGTPVSQ